MKRINHRGTEAQRMVMGLMMMLMGMGVGSAECGVGMQVALDGASGVMDMQVPFMEGRLIGAQIGFNKNSRFPYTLRWDREILATPPAVPPLLCGGGDWIYYIGHRVNFTSRWKAVYEILWGIRTETIAGHLWGDVFTGIQFSPVRWQVGMGVCFRIK